VSRKCKFYGNMTLSAVLHMTAKYTFLITSRSFLFRMRNFPYVVVLFYIFFVLFYVLLCSMYCLFCDVRCIVCVYMCTVLLPPGGYRIVVNKYIISYIILYHITYHIIYYISYIISYQTLQTKLWIKSKYFLCSINFVFPKIEPFFLDNLEKIL